MNIDLTLLKVYKFMVKTFFFNNLEKFAIKKSLGNELHRPIFNRDQE